MGANKLGPIERISAALDHLPARLAFANGFLLIPLAALVASLPRMIRGTSCGHDFDFHLVSWMEVQRSWSEGVFYPHWAQTPNWGAGEPRFVFYPPLTWIFGALIGYIVNWDYAPAVLTYLCFLGAGLSVRALARQFLPAPNATLAGVIATTTPYALFTAYERTAFSELAAATWIPLLLLYTLKPPTPAVQAHQPSRLVPSPYSLAPGPYSLAPVFLALAWLTNAPAGVMASYLLAFAALTAAILHRAWWPILRAAGATILGLALAAFYLVPAAYQQRWIAIQQAVDIGMRIGDSWLFARHAAPDLELHDQVLRTASSILVFTCALALLALAICLLRKKLPRATRHFWLPLALLIPILFVVQLPISAPIWNLLPKLQFLQFPWRWLVVLGIPYSIFLAAATPLSTRLARWLSAIAWTAILLAFAAGATLFFVQYCDSEDRSDSQQAVFLAGTGVAGTDEYAALGADNSLVASGLPDACLVSDPSQTLGESDSGPGEELAPVWYAEQGSCDDTFTATLWQNEHKILSIDTDHGGFVILRLRRYSAWQIAINGKPFQPASGKPRDDGLIVLPVAAGPSRIEIRWITTADQIAGAWTSLIALLVLIALWLWQRKLASNNREGTQTGSIE
jgi:hypothetical protein